VAYLPQNPNALLFAESVLDEVLTTLRNHNLPPEQAPIAPLQLLDRLGLREVVDAYPRDLSVGQRERVALAAVLATSPMWKWWPKPPTACSFWKRGGWWRMDPHMRRWHSIPILRLNWRMRWGW